jgi:hypothetical protein
MASASTPAWHGACIACCVGMRGAVDATVANPAHTAREQAFDCVLFQSLVHYRKDQHEILAGAQRRLPRVYLEHDPPLAHPTNTVHPIDDPDVMLVHVSHYNALMWDSGRVPTRVVEHGVRVPDGIAWSAAANHPGQRRRLRG